MRAKRFRVTIVRDGSACYIPITFDPKAVFGRIRARAWDGWGQLSYTHQREHVEAIEEAKRPETRVRRIENAVRMVSERSGKS